MKIRHYDISSTLRDGEEYLVRWYEDDPKHPCPSPRYTEITCDCGEVYSTTDPPSHGRYASGIPAECDRCGRNLLF